MPPAFDHDELMERIDGDIEFLLESIEMLEEDLDPLLDQIREATTARDASALVTPAHTLKGMLSNFCAEAAERAAYELEMRGRENRLEDVHLLVDLLDKETRRLRAELQTFVGAHRQ